jgi:ABC-type glycerol-3-phosphate transport system substrate-binding protein
MCALDGPSRRRHKTKLFIFSIGGFMSRTLLRIVSVIALCALALTTLGGLPVKAADSPKGEITVWAWQPVWDGINNSKLLDAFKAQYPDIKVNPIVYGTGDVYQNLQIALTAGTGAPDVVLIEDSHIGQFVDLGGLTDMTEMVKDYTGKIVNYKFEQITKDGKVYGMPWDVGPVVTYYRRDALEKAGLSTDPAEVSKMVATWDDYLKLCKTILDKTKLSCFESSKANNDARLYEMMLWQQGLGYVNANGELTVDSAENIATLEKLGEFWKAGVTADQKPWTDGWYADFASEDAPVATHVEAAWMGGNYKGWIAPKTGGKWGVALMPAMKADQPRSANDGGSTFAIPEQSKAKDAAWAFIKFMVGDADNSNKLYTASDIFPGLSDSYSAKLFTEPDKFFNGQVIGQIYVDVAKQIPTSTVYGTHYGEINSFVATAVQKYATDAMSAADALKEAADAIRSQTGLK